MLTLFWTCLLGGLAFTLLVFLVGDVLEGVFDGIDALLDPFSLVGGVAAFGAAGIVLTSATTLGDGATVALAALIGVALAVVMHFAYVRPMKRSENSTGFSVQEYRGKLGEVITPIPARGFGEVLVRMGASNTFRQAASFEGGEIPRGARVVVVEIRDGDLLVAPFAEDVHDAPALQLST